MIKKCIDFRYSRKNGVWYCEKKIGREDMSCPYEEELKTARKQEDEDEQEV